MADLKEQRGCIEFCFLLGKTAAETVTMLREAFKEEALSQARVYEWVSRFKHGDMSLEDQPRSGRPSTSRTDENIQKIPDAIMFDCRRNNRCVGSIDWSSVELMSRVPACASCNFRCLFRCLLSVAFIAPTRQP